MFVGSERMNWILLFIAQHFCCVCVNNVGAFGCVNVSPSMIKTRIDKVLWFKDTSCWNDKFPSKMEWQSTVASNIFGSQEFLDHTNASCFTLSSNAVPLLFTALVLNRRTIRDCVKHCKRTHARLHQYATMETMDAFFLLFLSMLFSSEFWKLNRSHRNIIEWNHSISKIWTMWTCVSFTYSVLHAMWIYFLLWTPRTGCCWD